MIDIESHVWWWWWRWQQLWWWLTWRTHISINERGPNDCCQNDQKSHGVTPKMCHNMNNPLLKLHAKENYQYGWPSLWLGHLALSLTLSQWKRAKSWLMCLIRCAMFGKRYLLLLWITLNGKVPRQKVFLYQPAEAYEEVGVVESSHYEPGCGFHRLQGIFSFQYPQRI